MPRRVVLQPNGKLAIFSTVVDHFVMVEASTEEIIEEFVSEAGKDARRSAETAIATAKASPERFADSIETIELMHGPEEAERYRETMTRKTTSRGPYSPVNRYRKQ